ncbi:helix-turn-helix transcriptional regulator [Terrisporobacter petrolearius]|uniref:helix-turn-helix transcriptional regulator n=1 Tax=Terrisporobacter petrolearius TaxID=1460447 RepID=UPI0031CC5259
MPSNKNKSVNPYITKSIKYINQNLKKKITINEICQYINLSKYYFSRMFKNEIGVTPYRYIMNCKIEAIKEDLCDGVDINTIVSKYEFYDLSHLNKNFIKIYGITPLEYQESCKLENK